MYIHIEYINCIHVMVMIMVIKLYVVHVVHVHVLQLLVLQVALIAVNVLIDSSWKTRPQPLKVTNIIHVLYIHVHTEYYRFLYNTGY